MNPISIQNISKYYGKLLAVNHISLEINAGEIFGLIGPDGAGKTTLFRILTTLLIPDEGKATVLGWDTMKDYKQIRHHVGYMPGHFSLYQDLSVEENLTFFATIFHTSIAANYDLIKPIYRQLEPFAHRRAGALSGGMKQKLALCCALVHKPDVLFLDEPTTGVDPVSRKEFWEMLKNLKAQGITIMVSTPYMDEANLCDRIAFIDHGNILQTANPNELITQFHKQVWSIKHPQMYDLLKFVRTLPQIEDCYAFGEVHHCIFKEKTDHPDDFRQALASKGFHQVEIIAVIPNVEDCFLALIKQQHESSANI